VPVVSGDGSGRVVGMISDRDVCMAAFTSGAPLHRGSVGGAMAHRVTACCPEDGVANAEVHLSDGAAAVRDVRFDVVVTNPPFHQGRRADYSVAHQFIRDAASVLARRGRLYVVANRFIRYDDHMKQRFHQVSVAYEDNLYRVLLAVRPKKGRIRTS
jgi:16S rRNA (guanine1207-N2)-methyltransferase